NASWSSSRSSKASSLMGTTSWSRRPSAQPKEAVHDAADDPRPHQNRDCAGSRRALSGYRPGDCGRLQHAVGTAAPADPSIDRRAGYQDHRGDHHHRHWSVARLRRCRRRLPASHPDRVRPVNPFRGVVLLPLLLLVRRRSADLMTQIVSQEQIAGFEAPVHRALTEPILLAGAPRAVAILNGTVSAAIGLGLRLWIAGLVLWALGHMAAVWAAKRDPLFVEVVRRHVRYPAHFGS